MGWSNAINEILQLYTGGGGGAAPAPDDAHQDFRQVAANAPQDAVAGGLAEAMRSDRTPPFPEMASKLFAQSNPQQRAGLLNQLLGSMGPGALSGIGGLGSLAGLLGGGQVTPEQASQVQPQQVQQLAAHAEQKNPSVVDGVSRFYSQHPDVVKALGGMALAIAIQHIARRT